MKNLQKFGYDKRSLHQYTQINVVENIMNSGEVRTYPTTLQIPSHMSPLSFFHLSGKIKLHFILPENHLRKENAHVCHKNSRKNC